MRHLVCLFPIACRLGVATAFTCTTQTVAEISAGRRIAEGSTGLGSGEIGGSATDGEPMTKMLNEYGWQRRWGSETRLWSKCVDFLTHSTFAWLYELLDSGEGADMKGLDLAGADRAYQHYVDTCRRLGTKPMPWDPELAKWIETC